MKHGEDLEQIINKIELSHQAVSKTVSGYGSELKRVSSDISEVKTKLEIFIEEVKDDKKRISELEKFEPSLKGAKWAGGVAMVVIIALIGTITTVGAYAYNNDIGSITTELNKHEELNNQSIDRILTILESNRLTSVKK